MKCQRFDLNDRHIAIIKKAKWDGELATLVAALRHILDWYDKNQEEMKMNMKQLRYKIMQMVNQDDQNYGWSYYLEIGPGENASQLESRLITEIIGDDYYYGQRDVWNQINITPFSPGKEKEPWKEGVAQGWLAPAGGDPGIIK